MATLLSIGDFARATHLSVKTLRYYQQVELLSPADIDPRSGYRRYDLSQIPTAQVIRRFRSLDMPVDGIRAVLAAPTLALRNELIAEHLRTLEDELAHTRSAVASLRDLIEHPVREFPIEHRRVPPTHAAAIGEDVDVDGIGAWHRGALAELYATLDAQGVPLAGVAGGIYVDSLFSGDRGRAVVFLPMTGRLRPVGRVEEIDILAVELAIVVNSGPEDGIDRAYGALADYVTRHALAVAGPIREYYPVNRQNSSDAASWRTEIGWPIFDTGR
jgi:DNA-binding transcriptional MerR regulator/effector-binding domain-containing protein